MVKCMLSIFKVLSSIPNTHTHRGRQKEIDIETERREREMKKRRKIFKEDLSVCMYTTGVFLRLHITTTHQHSGLRTPLYSSKTKLVRKM